VRNGVVTISGDLEDSQHHRLARDIAKVHGVESIDQSQGASVGLGLVGPGCPAGVSARVSWLFRVRQVPRSFCLAF
jgi:hypothetical protein